MSVRTTWSLCDGCGRTRSIVFETIANTCIFRLCHCRHPLEKSKNPIHSKKKPRAKRVVRVRNARLAFFVRGCVFFDEHYSCQSDNILGVLTTTQICFSPSAPFCGSKKPISMASCHTMFAIPPILSLRNYFLYNTTNNMISMLHLNNIKSNLLKTKV